MKTFKIIVFSTLIVFHISIISVLIYGNSNMNFLLNMYGYFDVMIYVSILALGLLLATFGIIIYQDRRLGKFKASHEKDINDLKARLYDQQEEKNKQVTTVQEKPEEKEEGNPSTNDDTLKS